MLMLCLIITSTDEIFSSFHANLTKIRASLLSFFIFISILLCSLSYRQFLLSSYLTLPWSLQPNAFTKLDTIPVLLLLALQSIKGLCLFTNNLQADLFCVFHYHRITLSFFRSVSTSCIHVLLAPLYSLLPPGSLSRTFLRELPGSEHNTCPIRYSGLLFTIYLTK